MAAKATDEQEQRAEAVARDISLSTHQEHYHLVCAYNDAISVAIYAYQKSFHLLVKAASEWVSERVKCGKWSAYSLLFALLGAEFFLFYYYRWCTSHQAACAPFSCVSLISESTALQPCPAFLLTINKCAAERTTTTREKRRNGSFFYTHMDHDWRRYMRVYMMREWASVCGCVCLVILEWSSSVWFVCLNSCSWMRLPIAHPHPPSASWVFVQTRRPSVVRVQ